MNDNTTSLSQNDQIFATLIVRGKVLASVCRNNFANINDVVRFICASAGRFMGLGQLNIRNKTQGWSMNLALASKQSVPQPAHHTTLPTQYRQTSLFV
ncbi:MAG: hypothetical protein IK100_08110 [Muribaculaceae bacterium]|nr:hypothetical protein [Muribaculaceae bacterium]MBR5118591.1 hypothetical protein [Muribaculaceae bacterium]